MKSRLILTVLTAVILMFSVLTFAHAPDGEKTEFCAVSDFVEVGEVVTPFASPESFVGEKTPEICTKKPLFLEAPASNLASETAAPEEGILKPENPISEMEPIVIEEAPPPADPPQNTSPPAEQIESGTRTVDGQQQIYVPGFGWMDNEGGGTIQIIVGSEGSIDKQVGSMGGEVTDNCPND